MKKIGGFGALESGSPTQSTNLPLVDWHEIYGIWYTLPETNMAPENWWLEDVFPIGNADFQGLC